MSNSTKAIRKLEKVQSLDTQSMGAMVEVETRDSSDATVLVNIDAQWFNADDMEELAEWAKGAAKQIRKARRLIYPDLG